MIHRLTCEFLTDPLGIDTEVPRLCWQMKSRARGAAQEAYQVLVASSLARLQADRSDLWDSGRVKSPESVLVEYGGTPLKSREQCYWKVRVWDQRDRVSAWSKPARWTMGLLAEVDWDAEWIGMDERFGDPECPWLRSTFTLRSEPSEALAYVAAMGYYELYVNGQKVDDHVLSPAVSQHNKRAWYITHDVTRYLCKGRNCVALWLGVGWYAEGLPGVHYSGPIARAQLETRSTRGWRCVSRTDQSWCAHPSHISTIGNLTPGPMGGEHVNARLAIPDWSAVDLDDRTWPDAVVRQVRSIKLCAQPVEPNRIQHTSRPAKVQRLGADEWLIDMGTNLTGWLDMELPGLSEGQTVQFRYFDRLDPDEQYSFRQQDVYVAGGQGRERFCSRFNYHGFRYVKVKGLSRKPKKDEIAAHLIHTDFAPAGQFRCSNRLLNQIHDMAAYTLRCLSMGGDFVDCPHRERLGYGGDGQSAMESIHLMYQAAPLAMNWLAAWRDCQRPNGDLPHTAPNPCSAGGGPVWCGFILTSTYYHYLYYGDLGLVKTDYPAIKRWLKFVESHCEDNILKPWPFTEYRNWCLGDWAVPEGVDQTDEASIDVINNCFRVYCYDLAAQLAEALGKKRDARAYQDRAASAKSDVHRAFFHPKTKTYADGDQFDLSFPLLVGVVPEELRPAVMKKLEHEILVKNRGHHAVGLVGTYFLQKQLGADGRDDLVFTMTNRDTYPSYGYMLKNGATTTWEHWDGRASHIHNCYNAIGAWFYQGLAGILPDPDAPGFANVIVRPAIVGDLKHVEASYESIRGTIRVSWSLTRGKLTVETTIPPNTTATVYIPTTDANRITESGKPVASARGVTSDRVKEDAAVFRVVAGRYAFVSPWRPVART